MQKRATALFIGIGLILCLLFIADLSVGAVKIPLRDVAEALTGGDVSRSVSTIVVDIRLMKAVVAGLAGVWRQGLQGLKKS